MKTLIAVLAASLCSSPSFACVGKQTCDVGHRKAVPITKSVDACAGAAKPANIESAVKAVRDAIDAGAEAYRLAVNIDASYVLLLVVMPIDAASMSKNGPTREQAAAEIAAKACYWTAVESLIAADIKNLEEETKKRREEAERRSESDGALDRLMNAAVLEIHAKKILSAAQAINRDLAADQAFLKGSSSETQSIVLARKINLFHLLASQAQKN